MISLLVFAIGLLSAFLSSMSGAGSALFATPLLLLIGFPLHAVLAFNQVGASCWTLIAARNYLSDMKVEWSILIPMGVIGLVGVLCGVWIAVSLDPKSFTRLIGAIILCIVVFTLLRPDIEQNVAVKPKARAALIASGFPFGFYQAVFGSGNTMFTALRFHYTRGLELNRALGYSYLLAFPWCCASAYLFYLQGWFDWELLIPATLGSVTGAFFGSKLGKRRGSRFVRRMFVVFGGLLGLKMVLEL